jgi:hypothetical protein
MKMALIEIDGLPNLRMVMFHGKLLHNQMAYYPFIPGTAFPSG